MVLLPDCKCCGGGGPCWRCYTDVDTVGYDAATYQCFGPDDTPPDGFLPVGDCHKTQAECEAACGPPWYCNEKLPGSICPPLAECQGKKFPDTLKVKLNADSLEAVGQYNPEDLEDVDVDAAKSAFDGLELVFVLSDYGLDPTNRYQLATYTIRSNTDMETGEVTKNTYGNPPLYYGTYPVSNAGQSCCSDPSNPCQDLSCDDFCEARIIPPPWPGTGNCPVSSRLQEYSGSMTVACGSFRYRTVWPNPIGSRTVHGIHITGLEFSGLLTPITDVLRRGDVRYSFAYQYMDRNPEYPFEIISVPTSVDPLPDGPITRTVEIPYQEFSFSAYTISPNLKLNVQQRLDRTCEEIEDKPDGLANQCSFQTVMRFTGGLEIDVNMPAEEKPLGSCCLPTGDCIMSSHEECIDQCGVWDEDKSCDDAPCFPVDTLKQCFDQPQEGWTPVSGPHPDEASCEASCGTTKRSRTMPTTKATTGPGTELSKMLAAWGIHAKEKGCGCRSYQKKMDKGGPQWCRDHKAEILDHLAKEAKKRKLPFVKLAASKLVDLAIRRAERGQ